MSQELKKCPFKHNANDDDEGPKLVRNKRGWYVECQYCAARGPVSEELKLAIKWWNWRAKERSHL